MWCLTLKEETRYRAFKDNGQGRTSGTNREEVTAGWKKLNSHVFHNLYSSQIK
jgi:hypothetical protein